MTRSPRSLPWVLALGLLPSIAHASDFTPVAGLMILPPVFLLFTVGWVVTSVVQSRRAAWVWLVLLGIPGVPLFGYCVLIALQINGHLGISAGLVAGAAGLLWIGSRFVRAVSD